MKTTARFFLFLAAVQLAIGQPMIPVNNISPVNTDSLIGKVGSSGRAQNIPLGTGLSFVNGALTSTGGAGDAPANATYITQVPNATLTNEQPLSLLATGLLFVTTGTGVLTSVAPGTSGNIVTSNGSSWISAAPTGNVTAAGTLTSGQIVIGQGAKTIATSSVFSISGSNATVTGNLAVTGGMTMNNLTTANLSVTGNITAPGATNGKLLIGNTSGGNFTIASLTAGDGVTINPGPGTLTINATGSGGNVTGSSLTANAVVLGTGSAGITVLASLGTSGQPLISAGAGAPPAFGTLGAPGGGTGLATLTANNIITGNGTGSVTLIAPGTSGNVVTSNGTAFNSAAPTWFGSGIVSGCTTVTANSAGNLTFVAGSNIVLTTDNTAKSITIAASAGTPTTLAMTATLGSDDTYTGATLAGLNAGATIAQWEAVYVGASSTYLLADANGSGTYPARGLAVAAYSSTNPAVILREGPVRNDAWNWTPGGTIFLSTTPGGLTQTAPSASGDKVQQVGFALTADIAYFNFASGEYLTVQ